MSLTEARFHDLVDASQLAVEDVFDDSDLDLDLENSAGVLTVRFENGSQVILSRQEPLRQLWLAARSGGFHFRWDGSAWRDTRTGGELMAALSDLVSAQSGTKVDLRNS